MKHAILTVAVCLLPLTLLSAADITSDNHTTTASSPHPLMVATSQSTRSTAPAAEPDAELAALRARVDACLARGDREGAKVYESQVQEIICRRQPAMPVNVTFQALPEPPAGMADAGPDVIIHNDDVLSLAADYETDGTIWAAAGLPDSTVRIWKSTNHGESWVYFGGVSLTPKAVYDRIAMTVGIGDSNFVHVLLIHPSGAGDVYETRWNHDGTGLVLFPVWVGPDTIIDLSFCRDNVSPYYMYALVNEVLHTVAEQNAWMLRSTGFGKNWAVTDSFYNATAPCVQTGAGSWVYLALLPQVPAGRGQLNILWNKSFGTPRQWLERNPKPDTFRADEPAITPAFTMPESLAVTWVAYHHVVNSPNYDLLALHSTNGCLAWTGPTTVAGTPNNMELWPDLKNYRDLGNPYVNISYIENNFSLQHRRVYRQWAHAGAPAAWHDPTLVSDSQPFRSRQHKPQLAYTPGGPGTGAGCVFSYYPSRKLVWNAPWRSTPVSPDSLFFKSYNGTALMSSAKSANPAPANRTTMAFQYGQTAPCMDPRGMYVFEVYNSNLRRFSVDNGDYVDIALPESADRVCATDGNFLYVPYGNKVHKYTMAGTHINTTTLNITCDVYSFACANDTVWASPDRYNEIFYAYAASRFNGGSISEDLRWAVGPGTNGTGNIAFDGTYYYVIWIGTSPITFKRFRLNRTLYDSGEVSIDPRSVMCRRNPPTGIAEPAGPAALASLSVAPNPLRAGARVSFSLPAPSVVSLKLYDVGGRLAAVLARGEMPAGNHRVRLDRAALPVRGVYLLRLETLTGFATRKLVVD